ncbi:hypothetical protein Pyn_17412 [Prunus yedoensis var. nudiflora]|uniref:Uncharacterized protein n=1 Tax=Prunus yedoensis var. nudiflora TaxID=2094558 RepID=A0A314XV61_PRUYE|nr:hypothetical protein Pyn_17412 [Prunus yedoensis var. nudiflora]
MVSVSRKVKNFGVHLQIGEHVAVMDADEEVIEVDAVEQVPHSPRKVWEVQPRSPHAIPSIEIKTLHLTLISTAAT